ncbi:protein kinase domain-containing protein [Hyalangium sp.]|uniref:protein kinase domain-containing protein n=1 Tax=Hyalangium sp. TaxID=2028555 RepID=UPI002D59E671|nr:protein kinase [Hyalangium sp.]HYH96448.1 protein kinase [Hyalangium sp.]
MPENPDPPERQPAAGESADRADSLVPDQEDSFLRQVAQVDLLLWTPRPGERLGGRTGARFEIGEELGGGAMGRVFRAWDEELQRIVALKFLQPRTLMGEPRLRALLREEARAIAQLDHENIVRIFDVSEWRGQPWEPWVPFLVMECLEGESLDSLLRREWPGFRRALELVSTLAAGLAHAHEHHIAHRDLKPSNVFVTRKGQLKLIDFGLAHFTVSKASAAPHLPTAGTPPYMAPEQWRGEAQDERTDVWAAGIMLYELITGQLPYSGLSLAELRARVTSEEPVPPARQRRPDLPSEVEPVLARALAKDPAQRYPSAIELREALTQLQEALGPWREEPPALGPQRRQVTLVCCQLDGLAHLSPPLDAEASGELEATFQRRCSEILRQHGGTLASCIGDQVLACFGYPLAQEEGSEQAIRAGMHLADMLGRELSLLSPGALAVRVGIHTDLVTLDEVPTQAHGWTPSIQGEAPRFAAWLVRQAEPGTVLLSDATWTLVRGAFETAAHAPATYEGVFGTREVELHRILSERRTRLRFDRPRASGLTPLIGRGPELQQLLACWEEARSGHGTAVLLRGEAGIGKSRLIRELCQRVASEPHHALQAQCWAQSYTSAFHPIVEALQHCFHLTPEAEPPQRLCVLEAQLDALGMPAEPVRLIASFLSLPVMEESPHLRLQPQLQKERTFEALETLLGRLAAQRPILTIIEDLHWADPSTLELVAFLMRRAQRYRLCLVLSARQDFQLPGPSAPELRQIMLERLPAELSASLVREAAHGRTLPPEVLHHLVASTDGNPLFAEEMTRVVLDRRSTRQRSAPGGSPAVPITLNELLQARLDTLPYRQKSLAQLCAVVGRSFDHALLAATAGRSEAALTQDLAGLLDSGLLQQLGEEPPRYQFRHALLQEAAAQSLPRGTRRQHHQRIVQVLAEQFPDVAETQPERLAHHYTEAGDVEAAVSGWARAGERASRRSASAEAVSHFTQALRLLSRLPESAGRTREELRLRIALGIPLLQLQGYGSAEVEQTYERACVLFHEVGDALAQVDLSYWSLFHYHYARARFDRLQELGTLLVDQGQRQHNRKLLVQGHRALTLSALTQGDNPTALEHVEQALRSSDFSLEQHRALAVKHWINPRAASLAFAAVLHALSARPRQSLQCTQEAVKLAQELAHPHTSAFVLTYAGVSSQLLREHERVLEWANAGLALSREHRLQLWLVWSVLLRAWAIAEQGRVQEGLQTMCHGIEQVRSTGVRTTFPFFYGLRAEMHRKLGQLEAGLGAVRDGLEWATTTGEHSSDAELHRVRGELLRTLDREREAGESFATAIAIARQQHAWLFELRATVSLGRLLWELGRPEEARQRLAVMYARCEPGGHCVDLAEARALLARLSDASLGGAWEPPSL